MSTRGNPLVGPFRIRISEIATPEIRPTLHVLKSIDLPIFALYLSSRKIRKIYGSIRWKTILYLQKMVAVVMLLKGKR